MPYSQSGTYYKYLNPQSEKLIVFFHGLGSSLNYYLLIATQLSNQYGCLLLDNPGAGRTKLLSGSVTVKEIGSTALQVMEELGIEKKPLVLVGHSMSGMVVNYLASSHPDGISISAGILISPVHPLPATKPVFEKRIELIRASNTMEDVAAAVSANAPGSLCSELKKAFIHELVGGQDPEGYIANCGAIVSACSHEEEFRSLYKKITVPMLLVLGAEDKTTPYKGCVEYIALELQEKEIVTLDGVGHWGALEDDERVVAAMRKFLERIGF